jgi:hypothetical protein
VNSMEFAMCDILSCDSVNEIWQGTIEIFIFYEWFDT